MIRHSVSTSDGRLLNVGESGDRKGSPIFALHGTPGSLMLYQPHCADALKRGIRLISYDRSGYGSSSPHPGRKVADAAKDLSTIADALGLERFAVWGISGGGPHALACAAMLSKRVVAAASLASPAPYPSRGLDWLAGQGEANVTEFKAAMAGPGPLVRLLEPQRKALLRATSEEVIQLWESLLPRMDRAALAGAVGRFLASNLRAGLRSGCAGWRDDDLAFISDWGFKPSEILIPLLIYQGRHDLMVPYAHGRWLAEHIKVAEYHPMQNDGHLTLFERHVPGVHSWLLKHF